MHTGDLLSRRQNFQQIRNFQITKYVTVSNMIPLGLKGRYKLLTCYQPYIWSKWSKLCESVPSDQNFRIKCCTPSKMWIIAYLITLLFSETRYERIQVIQLCLRLFNSMQHGCLLSRTTLCFVIIVEFRIGGMWKNLMVLTPNDEKEECQKSSACMCECVLLVL